MKNKSIYLILISFLFTCVACEKHLDINVDPSYPGDAAPELLLPSSIAWTASRTGSDLQLIGSFWSQHYTQNNSSNQYNTLAIYSIQNSSYTAIWSSAYFGALTDLKRIIEKSEEGELWNYYVTAKVLTAFNYHILVDLYEKVPFTEALAGAGNLAPKYDESKTVYTGVIAILDEAIAKQDAAKGLTSIGSKDFIFKGDVDKWIAFAKTLKFKLLMRDFETNKSQLATLIAEGGLLTTDACMNGFEDKENNSNPLYENDRRKLNSTQNIKGAATLIDFLKVNNDPRLPIFFEPAIDKNNPADKNFYNGMPYGNVSLTQGVFPSTYSSRARLAPTDLVYFMSAAESYFLQAEYYARINDAVNAQELYNQGVEAAFVRWGLNNAADFTQVGGAYEFDGTNTESMIKSIITQKWIASTRCQAWDAFFDINRTGYPKLGTKQVGEAGYISGELVPAKDGVLNPGEFPHRLLIPKTSSDYNPNAPALIPITTKMWWHIQ